MRLVQAAPPLWRNGGWGWGNEHRLRELARRHPAALEAAGRSGGQAHGTNNWHAKLTARRLVSALQALDWDSAVQDANEEYRKRMHNIFM